MLQGSDYGDSTVETLGVSKWFLASHMYTACLNNACIFLCRYVFTYQNKIFVG